ncbi:MAG TPA: glycosyltransferase family 2 protein [Bacteroidia bacterium]|jgi:glycosyltransferase involved in cell wall biosynthesis|nr:glycosyltransferase family 2 protein [Bacteroidia bacterium]
MQPSISIITPSYNQGRYLEENIVSVFNQGIVGLEHIIIDGGSTDNSKEILEKHDGKLTYWVSEWDRGQSDAVNKGFTKATGEIIGWLNSDDYYPPGALQVILNAFSDPSVNVVCGASILFDEKGKQQKGVSTIGPNRGLEFHLRFPDINQPATFFRRKVMAEFMPLNTALHYIMDRELWTKYVQQYGIDFTKILDDTIVYFRIHSESKSGTKEAEFDNEYATLLYCFAKQNKLEEIARLLGLHYKLVAGYSYSNAKYPAEETTLNMLRYFILKRGSLVFNKSQFNFAKKAYSLLDIKNYNILLTEEKALKRITAIANTLNWTHFRLKRKFNLV